jgi:hypothetical protein
MRAESLDDLAERFHILANVDWAPVEEAVEPGASDLPQFAELRRAGLPPDRALDIQRGNRPTQEEAASIEDVLGVRLPAGATVVPLDLRRHLHRPK